jgi:hypothetical protein
MKKKCIDNFQCENFLNLGEVYEVRLDENKDSFYSVLVEDKVDNSKGRFWCDLLKTRFE